MKSYTHGTLLEENIYEATPRDEFATTVISNPGELCDRSIYINIAYYYE